MACRKVVADDEPPASLLAALPIPAPAGAAVASEAGGPSHAKSESSQSMAIVRLPTHCQGTDKAAISQRSLQKQTAAGK
eukprot:9709053-Alexandrium_andersonii.AAC.1